jgi:hypothetical protein
VTMTTGTGDWDDARLAAAFAARAAAFPPVPADLTASSVVERLGHQPRKADRPRAILAAAAAIMVLVGFGGLAAITLTHRPPSASIPATSQLPLGSGAIADAATELGLPRIGVSDAMAIHNAIHDDREMLVSGFLSNDPEPYRPTSGAIETDDCDLAWNVPDHLLGPACWPMLMANPESIVRRTATSVTVRSPTGPAVHAAFDLTFLPGTREVPIDGAAVPSSITVVGHFSDRRAASCPSGAQPACETTFLVDRILEVGGIGVYPAAALVPARAAAEQALNRAVPGLVDLVAVMTGRGELAKLEPSLAPGHVPASLDSDVIWLIQAIPAPDGTGAPRSVRTFLVGDGIGLVVEMTANGPVIRPDPGPSPSATPAVDLTLLMDLLVHPMTVSDALARRDLRLDDTELTVEGYASAPAAPISCPMIRPELPALDQCPNTFTWLSEQASQPSADETITPPAGPAFNMLLQPETILQIRPGSKPVQIVALGHFDDHRASACPADQVERCQKNFIVDAIFEPADPGFAPAIVKVDETTTARATVAEAIASAGLAADDPRVLAAFAIPTRALAAFEPAAPGTPALDGVDVVWIVRWVDRTSVDQPILRSRLVIDHAPGTTAPAPFELTALGAMATKDGTILEPSSTIDVAAGTSDRGVVTVEVADVDRRIVGAREVAADDLRAVRWVDRAGPPRLGPVQLAPAPGSDSDIIVRWLGSACDRLWRLIVSQVDPTGEVTIDISEVDPADSCRDVGISRTVVLQFYAPTTVGDITLGGSTIGG